MKHVITTLFIMLLLGISSSSFACKSQPRLKFASSATQPCMKMDEAEKKSPATKQRFQIPTARRFGVVRYS